MIRSLGVLLLEGGDRQWFRQQAQVLQELRVDLCRAMAEGDSQQRSYAFLQDAHLFASCSADFDDVIFPEQRELLVGKLAARVVDRIAGRTSRGPPAYARRPTGI